MPRKKKSNILRLFKYSNALLGKKLDEHADPEILLGQAREAAQADHRVLVDKATRIIGAHRHLESQIVKLEGGIATSKSQIASALMMHQAAQQKGDTARALDLEDKARSLAGQLAGDEAQLTTLRGMSESTANAAEQAKHVVVLNEEMLRKRTNEYNTLTQQAAMAKMQNVIANSLGEIGGLASSNPNIPNFNDIKEKIELDYHNAQARTELASNTSAATGYQIERAAISMQADATLDSIRAELVQSGKLALTAGPSETPAIDTAVIEGAPVSEQDKVSVSK